VTLRTKLVLAQVPLLAALVLVGVVGSWIAAELGRAAQEILRENYRSVLAAQRMIDSVAEMDSASLFCVAGASDRGEAQIAAARQRFESELRVQEGNVTEPGEGDATRALRVAWQHCGAALDSFVALGTQAQQRAAYFADIQPAIEAVRAQAETVLALNQDAMVRKSDVAQRAAERLNTLLVAAAVLGCLIGVLSSGSLTARLLRPLGVLSQAARRLGEGDSAARAQVSGRDEIAAVAAEFNTMAERLERYRQSTLGELLAAHRSSQAVIDSLTDPVVVLGTEGEILHMNAAADLLFELRAEDGLPGANAGLRGVLERVRSHVFAGKGPYLPKSLDEAVRAPSREGERRYLPRGTPVYSEQGAVIGASIVLQDVTRLLSLEEMRNDLVAGVAHELRTPLTSLRMAIHLLYEHAAGPLSDKQADLLVAAREDCERLQDIVEELLDVSRIQGGKLVLNPEPAEVEDLVRHAADVHRSDAELHGVELHVEVLPGIGEVRVDPERIALVFANLIHNAIRHSPRGGRVWLRARPEASGVCFEVADQGPGVPRELRQAIFEKYFQVPGAPPGGAGLGLFIAREIVRAHGGDIGVDDAAGGGAAFWFRVPRAGAAA